MAEILLSNQSYNERQFRQACGESLKEMQCSGQHGVLWPYEPYTVGPTTRRDANIIRALRCGRAPNIHKLSTTVGQENIVGVSQAMTMLHDTTLTTTSATATVHAARTNEFYLAVQAYQKSALIFRDATQGNGAVGAASIAMRNAFDQMQKQFQSELRMTAFSQKTRARRGTPLTDLTRAKNIARSSRGIQKLQLTSTIQAGAVGRFSRYGKALGTGLIAVDFASRINNVQTAYKAEGEWERELFIESSSFASSALMGTIAVNVGARALVFLTVATPVGWVGLIVVSTALAMGTNYLVKDNSSSWYDDIIDWTDSW